jgi:hypothetical protein
MTVTATPLCVPNRPRPVEAPVRLAYSTSTGDAPRTPRCAEDRSRCIWQDLVGAWVECVECGRLDQWFD